MVNFRDLQGISPQANAGQAARMQALQTAVAGELDLRGQKIGLLKQGIASGAPLLGDYLERKSKRDQSKKEIERNKEYGNQVADYLGLPSISEVEKFQGLEFSGELDETPTVNEQGQYQLGAKAIPPIDPQKLALSKMIRAGNFSPKDINELDQILAYGDEITPRGTKEKYTALNTKSEYESLEGAPGTGTSRRNISRDVDINKGKADIANIYDTIGKRKDGNATGGAGGQAVSIASALNPLMDTLRDINNYQASNPVTRSGAGLVSKITGGVIGGQMGEKVASYDSFRDAVGVEIAKLGQSGNLTEGEQKRAFALLPNPSQSVKRQEEQYRQLANFINAKAGAQILDPRANLSGKTSSSGNVNKASQEGKYDFSFGGL